MEPGRVLGAVEWRFGGVVGGVARVSTTTVCTLLVQEIEHVHVYYTLHSAALTRPPPHLAREAKWARCVSKHMCAV